MAYVRAHETKQKRNGKPVKTYAIVWRESVRDEFGLPIPINADNPDGPKQLRARRETYPTREAAEARRDELNAAKHGPGGTGALAEQRARGEQLFCFYARGWLDAQQVRVASGKVKQRTLDEYDRQLRCYVLDDLGGLAVAAVTPAQCEQLLGLGVEAISPGRRQSDNAGHCKAHLGRGAAGTPLRRTTRRDRREPADRVDFSASRATGDHARFVHRPLSAAEVGALSAAVAGNPPESYDGPALPAYPAYALLVEFLAYTGLRASEAAGLEVGDLVFAPGPRCAVNVRRTKEQKNGAWVVGTPKSKRSRRTVPLPPWLAGRMADHLATVHPRADEPTAPLWPSRKNGGGHRQPGRVRNDQRPPELS